MIIPKHINDLFYPPICDFKKLAQSRIDKSRKVFDLNQAVPDYSPPQEIRRALVNSVDAEDYPFYTQDEGLESFRQAVSNELSELYLQSVSPERICAVAGANNGFFSVLNTVAAAGDEVIFLVPYYFNHYMAATIRQIKPVEVLLDNEREFALDLAAIDKKIGPKTKAVVFVNPCNPTGKSYSQGEVDALFNLCKKNNILLISDEVYNYFHDDYPNPASVLNIENFQTNAVSIHSYSKTFSLTGFRIGFIVASEELLHNFIKVHDTNVICAPRVAQIAATAGLLESKPWLEEKVKMMKERERIFVESFSKGTSSFKISSSGGFFVYLTYSGFDLSSEEICLKFIERENMVMLPASFFGPKQNNSIRLALGKVDLDEIPFLTEKIHGFSV